MIQIANDNQISRIQKAMNRVTAGHDFYQCTTADGQLNKKACFADTRYFHIL